MPEPKQLSLTRILMIKIPKNLISLADAARKYGFKNVTLLGYAKRSRLEAVKIGWAWYTTDAAMRTYLRSRDLEKIPKRYRGRRRKRD